MSGDKMKRKILLCLLAVLSGIIFTFLFLNNSKIYAKEEYYLFAIQIGAYKNYDNALKESENKKGIIIKDNNYYKVYVGIYRDTDILNEMVVYYENNKVPVIIKSINVDKSFYKEISQYEKVFRETNNMEVKEKIRISILNSYNESLNA